MTQQVIEMVSAILREALNERGYRTDGDVAQLADRCRHMAREDRDVINMQRTLVERYRGEAPRTDSEDVRLPQARKSWGYKWPKELPGGVMFYGSLRITREVFERGCPA